MEFLSPVNAVPVLARINAKPGNVINVADAAAGDLVIIADEGSVPVRLVGDRYEYRPTGSSS